MNPPITDRRLLYKFGDALGNGTFSTVYQATKIDTNQIYAIKVFPKSNLQGPEDEQRFQREINAMAYLKYINLVAMHDFFWDEDSFYMVVDYCEGGELFDYIIDHGKLNEPIAALIFKQIVGAISYCHSFGVAHRDLKPENILFSKFPTIKVTDFGLCGYISQEKLMQTFCGSPCYCAPECLSRVQYDGRLADIWSLGVILYSMITGEHPWNVFNTSIMLKQIMAGEYRLPDYLSSEVKDLITSLMQLKPQDRIPISEVLKHPWISFADWALVSPPKDLDLAISLIVPQPLTLEQISSSSSQSGRLSDHGIVSPFVSNSSDTNNTDEEDTISLKSFNSLSQGRLTCLSSSLGKLPTKPLTRRKRSLMSISSRGSPQILVPQVRKYKMSIIRESGF